MRLTDGTKLQHDWTIVGGEADRADRLLLSEDGYARRNKNGNLFTLDAMTPAEREQLSALRQQFARIVLEHHSGPDAAHPSAHRLRFDGWGSEHGEVPVREFAERVLARLAHQVLLRDRALVVVAVVVARGDDGRAQLRVERVLKGRDLRGGDRVDTVLPDGRAGAGAAATVFVLSEPTLRGSGSWQVAEASYLKISPETAEQLVAP